MVQIKELQGRVNSVNDARQFFDPEPANSSGLSHVPSQPRSIPSPRGLICRVLACSLLFQNDQIIDSPGKVPRSENEAAHLIHGDLSLCALDSQFLPVQLR